jgi:hypothetical protein
VGLDLGRHPLTVVGGTATNAAVEKVHRGGHEEIVTTAANVQFTTKLKNGSRNT